MAMLERLENENKLLIATLCLLEAGDNRGERLKLSRLKRWWLGVES